MKSQFAMHRKSLFTPLVQRSCFFGSGGPRGIAPHLGSETIRLTQLTLLKSKIYFFMHWLGGAILSPVVHSPSTWLCSAPIWSVLGGVVGSWAGTECLASGWMSQEELIAPSGLSQSLHYQLAGRLKSSSVLLAELGPPVNLGMRKLERNLESFEFILFIL